jgi:hypothetical protein
MKKENIIRTCFWGLITFITLALGITGLIHNNITFSEKEHELKNIVRIFNTSNIIMNYENVNSSIIASIKGKKIKIKYDGLETKEYVYKYKTGRLETELDKTDSIGKIILMVLTDSIAVSKGQIEGDTYNLFTENKTLKFKFEEGISYEDKKTKYKIKINLDKYIKNDDIN